MIPMTLAEVAAAVGGRIAAGDGATPIRAVTTDSRRVPPGALFVALQGDRFDAHDFVAQAAAVGAAAAIVSRPVDAAAGLALVSVPDTLRALGDLAAEVRRRWGGRLAGITGSAGKTTTKEILASICRVRRRTLATEGNLNNLIGVPLTLLRLDARTDVAVVEAGMSLPGEMARLAEIMAPDVGVVTAVGPVHLEVLGSVEAVREEKAVLLAAAAARGGVAVLDADSPHAGALRARAGGRVRTVSASGGSADLVAREVEDLGLEGTRFRLRGVGLRLRLPGLHNVANALLAASAAEALGIDAFDAATGIERMRPIRERLNAEDLGGVLLIDDAYNASPLSVSAALDLLRAVPARRRLMVFADMLELGADSERLHAEIGAKAAAAGVSLLLWTGAVAAATAAEASRRGVAARRCGTNEELVAALEAEAREGDAVLVKASHGMRLHEVAASFRERRRTPGKVTAFARKGQR